MSDNPGATPASDAIAEPESVHPSAFKHADTVSAVAALIPFSAAL
jgi:hypothetical protein